MLIIILFKHIEFIFTMIPIMYYQNLLQNTNNQILDFQLKLTKEMNKKSLFEIIIENIFSKILRHKC